MSKTIIAEYSVFTEFSLPDNLDIKTAFEYWIKWNTLFVVWVENGPVIEYESDTYSFEPDMKYPNSVSIENC